MKFSKNFIAATAAIVSVSAAVSCGKEEEQRCSCTGRKRIDAIRNDRPNG